MKPLELGITYRWEKEYHSPMGKLVVFREDDSGNFVEQPLPTIDATVEEVLVYYETKDLVPIVLGNTITMSFHTGEFIVYRRIN